MKTAGFLLFWLINANFALSHAAGISYQGRIFKPDGQALEASSVMFRMQVRSPGAENCLLFEEIQTVNMTGTSGVFSITLNDGSGSRVDTPTYSFDRIFANRDVMTLDSTRCTSGTTYTPTATDSRKFIVYFKDETMAAYEPLPILTLNNVPQAMYALESQKVGPFTSTSLLRAVDGSGNPVTAPALNPAQLTSLTNLIAGGGTSAYSAITGATATNTIDNTNFAQNWNWSSATTQSPMSLSANANTTGSLLNLLTSSASFNSISGLINVANTGPSTSGILARFQSNSTAGSGLTVLANGNVGIGTVSPSAKLEVVGETKVGNSGLSCAAGSKGSIRYNDVGSILEFCNGTAWTPVQTPSTCSDPTPNAISFTNEANATISTLYTSDIQQINGINCSVTVTISGQGSPQFRICSDVSCTTVVQGWTSSPSSVTTGQYIQARLTTDSVGGSQFKATIIAGSGASVWSVTNSGGDCTASPVVGTVCADGTIYAGNSPDGGGKMFTTRCDLGQTWDGSNCTGVRLALSWNNGTSNWTTTGFTSGITGQANSAGLNALADAGAPYAAAQNCEVLNINGKTDWYLPALTELNVLYSNAGVIRNFNTTGSGYLSSSEGNNSIVNWIRFSDGLLNDGGYSGTKAWGLLVRCVRR
jgi:hypothetical protein